jgi:hypothetical protein
MAPFRISLNDDPPPGPVEDEGDDIEGVSIGAMGAIGCMEDSFKLMAL